MTHHPRFLPPLVWSAVLLACGAASTGCSATTVQRVAPPDPITATDPSPAAQGLTDSITDPASAAERLRRFKGDSASLLLLGEFAYRRGRDAEPQRPVEGVDWYAVAAGCGYRLLACAAEPPDACGHATDLYNAAVSRCIRVAQRTGRLDCGRELALPGGGVPVVRTDFPWADEDFGSVEVCADFRVLGLERAHHTEGVGVPVVVTRPAARHAARDHLPASATFPATVVLRFDAGVNGERATVLELVNPLLSSTTRVGTREVPLAADLTTPLARQLSEEHLDRLSYLGFLRSENVHPGIAVLEPYQPGKIPVILVHGLLSSPMAWAPLVNDLRADPVLRARYQFWAFYYPTGDPFLTTAADFRDALDRIRQDFDPDHRDAALDQIVLVSHSMGGLLSKLVTQDGGPDLWRAVSARPFEEATAPLSPKLREELRRMFFFKRQPEVRRVVFIATPHRGSPVSPSLWGRLASGLVRLRDDLLAASSELSQALPELAHGRLPTSVELLAPDSVALEALAKRPAPAGVCYHSIIGVQGPRTRWFLPACLRPTGEATDSIVPYQSAHLDGVESELLVPANHFAVHQVPATCAEVRRILYEQLRPTGPVSGPPPRDN